MEEGRPVDGHGTPMPGQTWRHFKGKLYEIVCLSADSSDKDRLMVVYRALYGSGMVWVRPLDEFMSMVDEGKYPEHAGEYRFLQVAGPVDGVQPDAGAPCDAAASMLQARTQGRVGHDTFMSSAEDLVRGYASLHAGGRPFRVFTVWSCKTIQNSKAIFGTTLFDGRLYECTLNGDRAEVYMDVYAKEWHGGYRIEKKENADGESERG